MREAEFREFLESIEEIYSKEKAVRSRISRANITENLLGESLDCIVSNDDKMYCALLLLKVAPEERSGNLQNALRWYYRFVNGKEFPRLATYEKEVHNRI